MPVKHLSGGVRSLETCRWGQEGGHLWHISGFEATEGTPWAGSGLAPLHRRENRHVDGAASLGPNQRLLGCGTEIQTQVRHAKALITAALSLAAVDLALGGSR